MNRASSEKRGWARDLSNNPLTQARRTIDHPDHVPVVCHHPRFEFHICGHVRRVFFRRLCDSGTTDAEQEHKTSAKDQQTAHNTPLEATNTQAAPGQPGDLCRERVIGRQGNSSRHASTTRFSGRYTNAGPPPPLPSPQFARRKPPFRRDEFFPKLDGIPRTETLRSVGFFSTCGS